MIDRDDKKTQASKTTTVVTTATVGEPNRDVLTGERGSHPVGTGIGAVGGAAAGAVLGGIGGPVGAVVGGVVGAVAGGLAGKGAAEVIDPTAEETFWRTTYVSAPYFVKTGIYDFNDYGPAYRYGWESRSRNIGRKFDELERELARDWDAAKGASRLAWSDAKLATQAAWQRVSDGQ